jgi:hypothetical protein
MMVHNNNYGQQKQVSIKKASLDNYKNQEEKDRSLNEVMEKI